MIYLGNPGIKHAAPVDATNTMNFLRFTSSIEGDDFVDTGLGS